MDKSAMLDKVVGHYAVVGTEEATEFLRLCDQLGLKWCVVASIYHYHPVRKYICIYDDGSQELSDESKHTYNLYGAPLKPFKLSTPSVGRIDVPFWC